MKVYLVYDPEVVQNPDELVESLGGNFSGVIAKVPGTVEEVSLPSAGYAVVTNSWEGFTVYPGPLTSGQVESLPDPGPSPMEQMLQARAQLKAALESQEITIDPAVISTALSKLDDIINSGSVPVLGASPTNADVIQQVRTLTTATNLLIDACQTLARIDKGIIKLLT